MRVSLITDAPYHNHALMRISAYHKSKGDDVFLNDPMRPHDLSYGSWLFSQKYHADINGGPAFDPTIKLDDKFPTMPDYSLYPNLDCSIGSTWDYCPRHCPFCIVPKQNNPKVHRSIWTFHNPQFKKIILLNNNTFSDPQWHETFEEIWDAGLIIHDENGYDARLMNDEKGEALHNSMFDGYIHFAWDSMADEQAITRGLTIANKHHLRGMVYVLIGYNTTRDEDLYRCQVINTIGFDPYPMPFNGGTKEDRTFKRFICLRGYRNYKTLTDAWQDYNPTEINRRQIACQS